MIIIAFIGSIAFAMMIPGIMKRSHIHRQNDLLDRCRALYVLAIRALELGDSRTATHLLIRIRRIEARWHYGNSKLYRVALALWAIGVGIVGYILLRAFCLVMGDFRVPTPDDFRRFADGAPLLLMLGLVGSVHALASYFGRWTDHWHVDNCGDRLERILLGGRDITIGDAFPESLFAEELTPAQIFRTWLEF
jgi:hypothetical protein